MVHELINLNMSVIVLNWNGRDLLKKCMPPLIVAVEYVKGTHEIIVVDNGSSDGSVQFLKSKFPKVKVIALERNFGISPASNIGAKSAKGEILVFLNNDIMLKRDSLKFMLKYFKKPEIFGVSPKLIKWDKKTIEGEFFGTTFVLGTVVQTRPNMDKIDTKEFKLPRLTAFAPGGASAIDKKKFLELGGFDEIYSPFYMEDVDLSYRAYKRGWICIYEPSAVFYHRHGATLTRTFGKETLQLQELKNRFILTWSNFHDTKILLKHFVFLPLVFLRSIFKSSYRSKRFLDIIAFFQALKYWRRILEKRSREKKYAKLSDKEVLDLINSNQANEIAPVNFRNFLFKR